MMIGAVMVTVCVVVDGGVRDDGEEEVVVGVVAVVVVVVAVVVLIVVVLVGMLVIGFDVVITEEVSLVADGINDGVGVVGGRGRRVGSVCTLRFDD